MARMVRSRDRRLRAIQGVYETLRDRTEKMAFQHPVAHVYHPLRYAWEPFWRYHELYADRGATALLLGMNPGPFGMAQTGVPFGDVSSVRDFLGVHGRVRSPTGVHPRRPVKGFDLARREVSGARLWGWAQRRFGTAEAFFRQFFVVNYCPTLFLGESGRNLPPDKLRKAEREELEVCCDGALRALVQALEPNWLVGLGVFAERCAHRCVGDLVRVGRVLHPSPASPRANRGWMEQMERELAVLSPELLARKR